MFLYIWQKLTDKMKEEHRQAIKEMEAALALLNDDLTELDCRIQKLEFDNVALQAQRDVYESQLQKCQDRIQDLMQNRHVPRAEDPGLDTIVMIIEKNSTPEQDEFYEYPYYIARIQRRYAVTKKRWFRAQYPNHHFIVEELDNPNSIHAFNRFEEARVYRATSLSL